MATTIALSEVVEKRCGGLLEGPIFPQCVHQEIESGTSQADRPPSLHPTCCAGRER